VISSLILAMAKSAKKLILIGRKKFMTRVTGAGQERIGSEEEGSGEDRVRRGGGQKRRGQARIGSEQEGSEEDRVRTEGFRTRGNQDKTGGGREVQDQKGRYRSGSRYVWAENE
jgi:hypothetical protein